MENLHTLRHNLHTPIYNLQYSHKVISNWLQSAANEIKVADLEFLWVWFWPSSIATDVLDPWPAVSQMLFVTEGTMQKDVNASVSISYTYYLGLSIFLTNGMDSVCSKCIFSWFCRQMWTVKVFVVIVWCIIIIWIGWIVVKVWDKVNCETQKYFREYLKL